MWGRWSHAISSILKLSKITQEVPEGSVYFRDWQSVFHSNRSPFISQLLLIQKSVTQHLVCEETAQKYLGLSDEILFGCPWSSAIMPSKACTERYSNVQGESGPASLSSPVLPSPPRPLWVVDYWLKHPPFCPEVLPHPQSAASSQHGEGLACSSPETGAFRPNLGFPTDPQDMCPCLVLLSYLGKKVHLRLNPHPASVAPTTMLCRFIDSHLN